MLWTVQETNIIENHYPTTRCQEMLELLPNRTQDAIVAKAKSLGIRKQRLADGYLLNETFFKMWSIESAYLFGYLSADGCLKHYNNNGYFIQISIKEADKPHLDNIKNLLGYGGLLRHEKTGYGKYRYVLVIGSKKMYYDLTALGLTQNKTHKLQFPLSLPKELYRPYLRGFTDGDGTISYHKRPKYHLLLCKLGCATQSFVEIIRDIICDELGLPKPMITQKKNMNFYVFSLSGYKAKKYLNWIYQYPLFIKLERKYQRYMLFDDKGQSKAKPPDFS